MTRVRTLTFAFACLVAAAGPVRAGTVSYDGYSVLNNQNVTLGGIVNEVGGSGQISYSNVTGFAGTLATFCVDIFDDLKNAGSFATGGTLTGTFGTVVNALMTNVLPTLATDYNASSALQVAIWESEYGSGLTVSTADAVTSLANTYLANVGNGSWTADPTKQVNVLQGVDGNQTQAYLAPVPEPASILLIAGGLLGTTLVRRKRRA